VTNAWTRGRPCAPGLHWTRCLDGELHPLDRIIEPFSGEDDGPWIAGTEYECSAFQIPTAERLAALEDLAAAVDAWIQAEKAARALGRDFKLQLAALDAKRAMLTALAKVRPKER
jgi:hypothetical protein